MKDNLVYIEHMLDCIERIHEYAAVKADFCESRLIQDAVTRNFQVMAESSQRLSDDIKAEYDEIAWRKISGFRNILEHDYLGLDLHVIWSVVEKERPLLETTLGKIKINLASK
jgi:uncharacterized protein with HEPN domain